MLLLRVFHGCIVWLMACFATSTIVGTATGAYARLAR